MSERDENKAIMLARCNPNIGIAEIASDLNTTMDAHQVSGSTISKKPLLSITDPPKMKKRVERKSCMDSIAMEKINFLGRVEL